MNTAQGMRVYGSGLLSSFGEIEHAIESPDVRGAPLQLETAIHQDFKIYYATATAVLCKFLRPFIQSGRAVERWMKKEGKLNNVGPGEPELKMADLESFLIAAGV